MTQWYSTGLDLPIRVLGQALPGTSSVRTEWALEPLMIDGRIADRLTLEQVGAYIWLTRRQMLCQPTTTRRLAEHLAQQGYPPEPHEPERQPDHGGAGQIVHVLERLGLVEAEPEQQQRLNDLAESDRRDAEEDARRAASRSQTEARPSRQRRPLEQEPPAAERHQPDADGQWSGAWPLATDACYPARGQNVVYLLRAANDLVVYVGSTNHFTARMKAHHSVGKRWARWTAQACETRQEAYDVESEFLQTYMPHLNIQGPRT